MFSYLRRKFVCKMGRAVFLCKVNLILDDVTRVEAPEVCPCEAQADQCWDCKMHMKFWYDTGVFFRRRALDKLDRYPRWGAAKALVRMKNFEVKT